VLKKAIYYASSKNPVLIFGGGWVGVVLIIHVQRTSKVRRTPKSFFFNTFKKTI
jgi:hypothetical protein